MRIRTWAVGLFIIAGLAFFTAILFLIGNRQKAFGRHLDVYTEFSNLGGLASGAKVQVSGLDAGKLKRVQIPHDPSGRFRLELELEDKVRGMIRKDSVVSIQTEGVVGDKFISIAKGSAAAAEITPGATLPSKEPMDIAALLEQGSGMLKDVHSSINDIHGRVDVALSSLTRTVDHADGMITDLNPHIQKIARDGGAITGHIRNVTSDLDDGKGPAGLLLKDQATRQQLQATLGNVQQASSNLDQASARANQTIEDFQARNLIGKADGTLANVQSMSQDLDTSVKQALADDNIGQSGGANLRETLSNLNRSTANLAEDTEALKHNFFFRGFFKKRGFYSLDQLTPAEYEKACARQKDAGTRKWLNASQLVASEADGREKLSDTGRQEIDSELAPVLDSLPAHVIVVEGYADTGSPDRQFSVSRSRADLVRHYLEQHYHVRHSNVGIVAMRAKPPENAGRDSWNGAAIMIFKNKAGQ